MLKQSTWTTTFASFQWLFFIFANTIVVPVSVGTAFELSPDVIAMTMRSSLIFTGIACMLQGFIGHRYPLMEGHSGMMWGLVLNLALSGASMGLSYTEIGGGIATGILLAGIATVLLAAFNLVSLIQKIFTPMVMSVYLFLLTFQLVIIFFNGMLKVTDDGKLDLPISLYSIVVVILVSLVKIKGKKLGNFAILIGIIVGWGFYEILFPGGQTASTETSAHFSLFPFGKPNLEYGIVIVSFLGGFMNLSNTIASIQAAEKLYKDEPQQKRYRFSFLLTGFHSIIASLLGLVAYAPFTSSIGFLESTQILKRLPFIIGGGMLSILGIIPVLGTFFASMPITVGNAVLFVAYLQLLGTSLKSLSSDGFDSITIYRLAGPVLLGVCLLNISPEIFADFPVILRPIITNGLIMGVILSVILEKVIKWESATLETKKS
ncbi:uracil/xanthine transporter [Fredinandcohnia quinoae]|uniref:Uracil/xanthine transporter n=1 Tax=Fredinandcohnia quinoae TaxID=2918902 RepID=A0AAW5ECD6_9BACI|nr:uracil/xanthine transporter [Fredinandcohnia sp. SECRCQ15]MCH1627657.1 uracil/xanthine transporter [Fredinandcohnia sp. SECRCQ15]